MHENLATNMPPICLLKAVVKQGVARCDNKLGQGGV